MRSFRISHTTFDAVKDVVNDGIDEATLLLVIIVDLDHIYGYDALL